MTDVSNTQTRSKDNLIVNIMINFKFIQSSTLKINIIIIYMQYNKTNEIN